MLRLVPSALDHLATSYYTNKNLHFVPGVSRWINYYIYTCTFLYIRFLNRDNVIVAFYFCESRNIINMYIIILQYKLNVYGLA